MKTGLVLFCVVCAAMAALSPAEPSATVIPAEEFNKKNTTTPVPTTTETPAPPKPTTTPAPTTPAPTTPPKTTTPPTTDPPKPTTTVPPKPTTTVPPKPTTTDPPKPTTTDPPKPTTTDPPKPTTTDPPKPTTTDPPKPTTTVPPKPTTTAPPKPTTTAPPTTPPKTTAPPTTAPPTTAPPKPTTPAPTPPLPTPATNLTLQGNYSVKASDGTTCIMADMTVQIRLQVDDKTRKVFSVVPKEVVASGGCTGDKANLTLGFKQGHITFLFNKNKTDKAVYVDSVAFHLAYPLSDKSDFVASNSSVRLFSAAIGHSYSCRNVTVDMGNRLSLDITGSRMQAFDLTKSKGYEFGTQDRCQADKQDYRVAIAVGVTLLVLIVIVVIVYLIGRRRRSSGYQSL